MTKEQLLQHYGETRTKDIAGILHNYVFGDKVEDHNTLEGKIRLHGNLKVKDSIKLMEDLLEFEG
jgi:hypothetical protein